MGYKGGAVPYPHPPLPHYPLWETLIIVLVTNKVYFFSPEETMLDISILSIQASSHKIRFWTLFRQHPMKSFLWSVLHGVFIHLSKLGSLFFPDILHDDDSWPWYLVMAKPDFKKNILAARIWPQGALIRSKVRFFTIFLSLDD